MRYEISEEELTRLSRESKRLTDEFSDYDMELLDVVDYVSASIYFHLKTKWSLKELTDLLSSLNDSEDRTGEFSLIFSDEKISCIAFTSDNETELEPTHIKKLKTQVNISLNKMKQIALENYPN